ncbi:energy transducer TonB [Flavobacterium sp. RSB2_4_14]|uniref:energy transducer TonB n=1 Tax=Flavobacterium sp. RSB2_4_14 TaxID=3447665 RepID=UPI003F30668F
MKKKILFSCLILLVVAQVQAIVSNSKTISYPKLSKVKSNKNIQKVNKVTSENIELFKKTEDTTVYAETSLKVKPEYPGGVETFKAHINIVLENPKNIKGEIVVCFIIEKNGSLSKIKVLKGIDDETDKEILKVLKHSPKWKPGEKDGQKVRCMIPLFLTINGQ